MRIQIAVALLLLASPVFAATIQPSEASKHIGESATVEGIASVFSSKGGTIFVDLGGKGMSAPFTGVIFKNRVANFPNVESYNGQTVDMMGVIKEYRGKPEIILDSASQIAIRK